MPLTRSQRLQAALIGTVVSPLMGLLCRTLRWQIEGAHYYDQIVRSGRQPILALWHGRILPGIYYFRQRGVVVMTSQNFDGEWIARILERQGFGTARGSTSRGAVRALVQLRRELESGRPAAFTLDGPRGPARVAQPGAVWLAGATGNPLLPFHLETDRHWTASSWDRTQIPKPFSRVALAIGPPMTVAATDAAVVRDATARLEATLRTLEARAIAMLADSFS